MVENGYWWYTSRYTSRETHAHHELFASLSRLVPVPEASPAGLPSSLTPSERISICLFISSVSSSISSLATLVTTSQLNSDSANTRLVSMMRMAVMRRSLSGSRMSLASHSLPLRSGFSLRKSTCGGFKEVESKKVIN